MFVNVNVSIIMIFIMIVTVVVFLTDCDWTAVSIVIEVALVIANLYSVISRVTRQRASWL